MNTIIIPVHHHHEKEPDPKCPHCKETLEGFSAPSTEPPTTFLDVCLGVVLIVLLIANLAGLVSGAAGAEFKRCDPFFSKRYHYIAPSGPAACAATRWLINKEVIFGEVEQ